MTTDLKPQLKVSVDINTTTCTRPSSLLIQPAAGTTMSGGGDGPHRLAAGTTMSGGGDGPHRLAAGTTMIGEGDGPHRLAAGTTMIGGGDGPHRLAAGTTMIGGGDDLPRRLAERAIPHTPGDGTPHNSVVLPCRFRKYKHAQCHQHDEQGCHTPDVSARQSCDEKDTMNDIEVAIQWIKQEIVSPYLSLPVSNCFSISPSFFSILFSTCLSLYIFLSFSVSDCPQICLSLFLYVSLCPCLSVCLYLSCFSVSASLYVSACLYVSLSVTPCFCLFV